MSVKVGFGITCGGTLWQAETVRAVEELGFDSFWTGEHIVYHRPIMDAVPLLTAAAVATSRIKIGSATYLLPLRHPTMTAKEFASLDIISGGRVIMGIGVGGDYPKEFEALHVPLTERGRRATEAIQIVKRYWTEPRFSFAGKHYPLDDVWLVPKPVQPGGPPIWVSGRKDAALRRAARYGDGVMPYFYTPDQCRAAFERVRELAAEEGRTLPPDYAFTLFQYISVHDDPARARQMAIDDMVFRYDMPFDKIIDKYTIMGSPQRCVDQIEEYVEAGVRYFIFGPVCELNDRTVRDTLELYATKILPHFQGRRLGTGD
ncbi:MAG: LLM class flavin-dependent oxidoreductase [Chloroflexi bacterium]|nr:LLM class flavin-dependent oxidoreductase [Chloroflexota bacterium]